MYSQLHGDQNTSCFTHCVTCGFVREDNYIRLRFSAHLCFFPPVFPLIWLSPPFCSSFLPPFRPAFFSFWGSKFFTALITICLLSTFSVIRRREVWFSIEMWRQPVLPKRWCLSTKLQGKSHKSQLRFSSFCCTLASFISYFMYFFNVFSDVLPDALLCDVRREMAEWYHEW